MDSQPCKKRKVHQTSYQPFPPPLGFGFTIPVIPIIPTPIVVPVPVVVLPPISPIAYSIFPITPYPGTEFSDMVGFQ